MTATGTCAGRGRLSIPDHARVFRWQRDTDEKENKMNETPIDYPKSRKFSAPLGSVRYGRLRFLSGASNVTVHTDPSTTDLYHARFEGSLDSPNYTDATDRYEITIAGGASNVVIGNR